MAETCVRCGKRRGSRRCRPLGGSLCARCCGMERLVRVACPTDCPHLGSNEEFQRAKQRDRYREAWGRVNQDLRGRGEDLERLVELERLLKEAADRLQGATDVAAAGAIAEVSSRLSPIELVTRAPSPLGRLFWEPLRVLLEEGRLSRDQARDGLARLGRLVDLLQESGAPRAFLQGLFAHVERLPAAKAEPRRTGLIVTPSDLRRAP